MVAGVGTTVWLTMFGFRVGRAVCLGRAAVVFGFERVETALGLVTSLPVKFFLSVVGDCNEGSGVRRRRSPKVNNILSWELKPESVLALVDLYVCSCKTINSFLSFSVTTCKGDYARSILEMKNMKEQSYD